MIPQDCCWARLFLCLPTGPVELTFGNLLFTVSDSRFSYPQLLHSHPRSGQHRDMLLWLSATTHCALESRISTGTNHNLPKGTVSFTILSPGREVLTSRSSHLYKPMSSDRKPDINLLRSKIILACHSVVREDIAQKLLRCEREIKNARWITNYPPDRARFFVLDGVTFRLRQYGTSWEARLFASKNPPLEAGNGVFIYRGCCMPASTALILIQNSERSCR